MTILQTACTSFKQELAQALHNFGPTSPDTFMLALYDETAVLGAGTTVYTETGEVVASGYTPGGSALTITVDPTTSGTVAYWSFADIVFEAALTARGALVYNATQGNRACFVLDFGANKTSQTSLTVRFPSAGATTAVIRIK